MSEHPVTCPHCGHTTEVRIVLDLGDQLGDQLVAELRRRIRTQGGDGRVVLGSP